MTKKYIVGKPDKKKNRVPILCGEKGIIFAATEADAIWIADELNAFDQTFIFGRQVDRCGNPVLL